MKRMQKDSDMIEGYDFSKGIQGKYGAFATDLPYSTYLRATHSQVASFTLNKAKGVL